MSYNHRRRRSHNSRLIAMPSHRKIRPSCNDDWNNEYLEDNWYGEDLIDEESLVTDRTNPNVNYGVYGGKQMGQSGHSATRGGGASAPTLVSNTLHWGLSNVSAERSFELSPPVIYFGNVQEGSLSRQLLRVKNCGASIARARVDPFRPIHQLKETENFIETKPNVARISPGLTENISISLLARGIGPFRKILTVFVSEHDLVYEIPLIGTVLPETGFKENLRCAELARKLQDLEINHMEKTQDAEASASQKLISSTELTVGWDAELDKEEAEKRRLDAASVDNVSAIPKFPNTKWNTFTNRLRTDHRKIWKVEVDTSVRVDVIKQRYEKMVSRSKSKWSNVEDRFHVAKMIKSLSGHSRAGALKNAAKKSTAAKLAFADRTPETTEDRKRQSDMNEIVSKAKLAASLKGKGVEKNGRGAPSDSRDHSG